MPLLNVSHITTYTYRQPVAFGEHRLMVRPRESYDQHLVDARLRIEPRPSGLRWVQDVFGNSVAIATFDKRASSLVVESQVKVDHHPAEIQKVNIEDYARLYPFTYAAEEMPDLLRSIERQHLDPLRQVDSWARQFLHPSGKTETLAMLSGMTEAIKRDFTYVSRAEKGTQTPIESLTRMKGTCRDYAVLMIEAARALGFAARFVSGYVYNATASERRTGGGNTHAWVRVYLPGSGWVEFDPTNGIVGNRGLIRVAVARDIYQAVPVSGTWSGFPGSFLDMEVSVDVRVDGQVKSPSNAAAGGTGKR
ncbi:transglutaminase family protein [Sphingosinicella rhizophila]|uniref:Transglutaminase family protein n=1 Tax=Sphingosinicella rhizophila TaxID=3050082 RepID=A0ABU3QA64_9SPHN|nr:transglutaminase family protein [Sphingosinicella sp. GR2756]MDT9600278.1 transglutaminase family protein [Sphingosinicella sp. GR2756]